MQVCEQGRGRPQRWRCLQREVVSQACCLLRRLCSAAQPGGARRTATQHIATAVVQHIQNLLFHEACPSQLAVPSKSLPFQASGPLREVLEGLGPGLIRVVAVLMFPTQLMAVCWHVSRWLACSRRACPCWHMFFNHIAHVCTARIRRLPRSILASGAVTSSLGPVVLCLSLRYYMDVYEPAARVDCTHQGGQQPSSRGPAEAAARAAANKVNEVGRCLCAAQRVCWCPRCVHSAAATQPGNVAA